MYGRAWILTTQVFEQAEQRFLLLFRARVLWVPVLRVHAANIADADRTAVVAFAMRAHACHVTSGVNGAIAIDDVMIPDADKAAFSVPAVNVFNSVVPPLGRCAAVNYDFVYFPHDFEKV